MERNAIHIKGVAARKDERVRQKQVKELDRQGVIIPIDKLTPIEDPEAEWKMTNSIWKMEVARKIHTSTFQTDNFQIQRFRSGGGKKEERADCR